MSIYKEFKKDFPNEHSYDYLKRLGKKVYPRKWELWNGDFPYIDSLRWDDRPLIIIGKSKDYWSNLGDNEHVVFEVTHSKEENVKNDVTKRVEYKYTLKDAKKEGLLQLDENGKEKPSYVNCNYVASLRPERFRNFRHHSITESDQFWITKNYNAAKKNGDIYLIQFSKALDKMNEESDMKYRDFIRNIKLI